MLQKAKRFKTLIVFIFCLFLIWLLIYRFTFYAPPLLDPEKRNFCDNTIDFVCFGWYLTQGSIIKDYLKDGGRANEYFAKAGWHRKVYLLNRFFVEEERLDLFLEENKNIDTKILRDKLYVFLMSSQQR